MWLAAVGSSSMGSGAPLEHRRNIGVYGFAESVPRGFGRLHSVTVFIEIKTLISPFIKDGDLNDQVQHMDGRIGYSHSVPLFQSSVPDR